MSGHSRLVYEGGRVSSSEEHEMTAETPHRAG